MAWLTNNANASFKIDDDVIAGLQSIPSLGGEPEKVDVTTLSDMERRYITGIKDYGELEFTFLYEAGSGSGSSNYATAKAKEGDAPHSITLTLRSGVTFSIPGTVAVSLNEANINEAYTFTITVGLTGEIEETGV